MMALPLSPKQAQKYILLAAGIIVVTYFGIVTKFTMHSNSENGITIISGETEVSELEFPYLQKDLSTVQRLMYNRVPKCGSGTTSALFNKLSTINKFHLLFVLVEGSKNLNLTLQQDIINKTRRTQSPWLYIQHFHWVDFRKFGERMPIYINLVRDPIERMMSAYYYRRFKVRRKMPAERRNMTFDECVRKKDRECSHNSFLFTIIPFFCGSVPRCTEPTEWALNRAKLNVIKYFSVVGYVEELDKMYYVLEKTMPQYFGGLGIIYEDNRAALKYSTSNKVKKTLTEPSREYLRALLGLEYDFYHFIKRRFEELYNRVKAL